jgi:hypothetical protein
MFMYELETNFAGGQPVNARGEEVSPPSLELGASSGDPTEVEKETRTNLLCPAEVRRATRNPREGRMPIEVSICYG